MAKYSFEFKKNVVIAYLNGEGGIKYLANKYDIADPQKVMDWVKKYQAMSDKGLMRSRNNEKYTFENKLRVVELYLNSEVSYRELALTEGIKNDALIVTWVNDIRIASLDALRPKKKGGKVIGIITKKCGKSANT